MRQSRDFVARSIARVGDDLRARASTDSQSQPTLRAANAAFCAFTPNPKLAFDGAVALPKTVCARDVRFITFDRASTVDQHNVAFAQLLRRN